MPLLTGNELSEILKLGKVTFWQYRKKGMPHIRLGSRVIRYNLDDVMTWLESEAKCNV